MKNWCYTKYKFGINFILFVTNYLLYLGGGGGLEGYLNLNLTITSLTFIGLFVFDIFDSPYQFLWRHVRTSLLRLILSRNLKLGCMISWNDFFFWRSGSGRVEKCVNVASLKLKWWLKECSSDIFCFNIIWYSFLGYLHFEKILSSTDISTFVNIPKTYLILDSFTCHQRHCLCCH